MAGGAQETVFVVMTDSSGTKNYIGTVGNEFGFKGLYTDNVTENTKGLDFQTIVTMIKSNMALHNMTIVDVY